MIHSYEELIEKYPKLYSKLSYFETNIGWLKLIEELSQKLEAINDTYQEPEAYIHASQVKQKFGGLRFYVDIQGIENKDCETCYNLIAEAEKASYSICESCSKPSDLTSFKRYYYLTLCKECQEASKSER